jgi:Putative ATP-dependent DNA helicase recG C-terminal
VRLSLKPILPRCGVNPASSNVATVAHPVAYRVVNAVLVSPSDVSPERDATEAIVTEINHDVLHPQGVHLELRRWEEDSYPGLHESGPQGLIDSHLRIGESDLVIGMFWTRFGSRLPTGETGTEHELRTAWASWMARGRPQVLLYYCSRPAALQNEDDALQLASLLRFRSEVRRDGMQFDESFSDAGELTKKLRSHLLMVISDLGQSKGYEPSPATVSSSESVPFLDGEVSTALVASDAVRAFRRELRDSKKTELPESLSETEFAQRLGVLAPSGRLTRTGALLFTSRPIDVIPTAMIQFAHYDGDDRAAPRRITELNGTAVEQITRTLDLIAESTGSFELPSALTGRSEAQFRFPKICLREVIANAVVHRDYEDVHRMVHVRLFTNRIEVASPGLPLNAGLTDHRSLAQLESESVKRNFTLARLLTYVRLVEGEGSGVRTALLDCASIGAPEPTAGDDSGYTTVTVYEPLSAVGL